MLNNLLYWHSHFSVIYFPYLFSQENRELHEIIMTLRDERDMKINEVNELKNLLAAVQDQNTEFLQNQVLRLTAQTTKLERNLNAKQGFLETIVTENETLKTELQTLKDEKITRVQDLKKGLGDLARSQPEVRQIMNQVYDNEDGNSEVANWFFVILFSVQRNYHLADTSYYGQSNQNMSYCISPVKIIYRIELKQYPTIPDWVSD